MPLVIRSLFLGFAALGASSVGAIAQTSAPQAAVSAAPAAAASAVPQDYRLGANDRVMINVYGEDDLSREYIVSPAGTISMPLVGDLVVQGRTADDLRNEIRTKLADGYLNNPGVTVTVSGYRNFYILGEVNKPGQYPYENGLTVPQAVAEAAGYTYRAAKRYVFIKHEGETAETRVPIRPDMPVRPGDTIRLGERYF